MLLVDEPTAELDEGNRTRVVGLLRDAADRGVAVVVATRDPDVVELCDRVVRLVDGRRAPDPGSTPRRCWAVGAVPSRDGGRFGSSKGARPAPVTRRAGVAGCPVGAGPGLAGCGDWAG